jgi:hypothetical protein
MTTPASQRMIQSNRSIHCLHLPRSILVLKKLAFNQPSTVSFRMRR